MNPIERAIVLDEAKNYTDKQRIAYIESKTIATPKDAAGTDFWGTGNLYVRVHNETVDLKTLTKFQMESSTGENIWLSDYELEDNVVLQIVNTPGSDEEVPLIIRILINDEGVEPGVYVLWNGDHGVSCIQYETIHPIDQKFIPGAPLFDLTKIGLPAVQLNSSVMVETTDVSEISAAMDAGNIKIKTLVSIDGAEIDVYANLLSAYLPAAQAREATTVLSFDGKIYAVILTVLPNYINFSISEV